MRPETRPDRQTRRTVRFRNRFGARLLGGLVIGGAFGAGVGLIVGSLVYESRSTAMWAVVIAAAVFAGAIGAFVGGISSLESPDPGLEPSQFEHPVTDTEGLTREESDDPLEGRRDDPPTGSVSRSA